MDDFIAHNPSLQTPDDAKRVLTSIIWKKGDGFFYHKTDCMCLEVRHVADIAQSLEMLGINDWYSSKDIENNLTVMLPAHHEALLVDLGIKPDVIELPPTSTGNRAR